MVKVSGKHLILCELVERLLDLLRKAGKSGLIDLDDLGDGLGQVLFDVDVGRDDRFRVDVDETTVDIWVVLINVFRLFEGSGGGGSGVHNVDSSLDQVREERSKTRLS